MTAVCVRHIPSKNHLLVTLQEKAAVTGSLAVDDGGTQVNAFANALRPAIHFTEVSQSAGCDRHHSIRRQIFCRLLLSQGRPQLPGCRSLTALLDA